MSLLPFQATDSRPKSAILWSCEGLRDFTAGLLSCQSFIAADGLAINIQASATAAP